MLQLDKIKFKATYCANTAKLHQKPKLIQNTLKNANADINSLVINLSFQNTALLYISRT